MTDDRAAFRATYTDWKLIRTRKVVQIVFEVPLELADVAYEALGGMPNPANEVWCALARLRSGVTAFEVPPTTQTGSNLAAKTPDPAQTKREDGVTSPGGENRAPPPRSDRNPKPVGAEKAKREWREMGPAQQAGIRCNEKPFWTFLNETRGYAIDSDELAAEAVREICCVKTRAHLETSHAARMIWHQLDDEYRIWKDHPELVA